MQINPCEACGQEVTGRALCRPCQYAWEAADPKETYQSWLRKRREKFRKLSEGESS
jgi:hypothetical protein